MSKPIFCLDSSTQLGPTPSHAHRLQLNSGIHVWSSTQQPWVYGQATVFDNAEQPAALL